MSAGKRVDRRRSVQFASHSLAPQQTYTIRSQALELKHGRVRKRGTAVVGTPAMPGPNDHWTPTRGLPRHPPS